MISILIHWVKEPFEQVFMQKALLAVILAAGSCALVGTWVVLRRMAFLGEALAHTMLPGVILAFLRGVPYVWGALTAALMTALGVGWLSDRREIREDTAVGVVLSSFFALGVLMMGRLGSFRDFTGVLFGSVLGVTSQHLVLAAVVAIAVGTVLFLLHKELELASFDAEYGRMIGARPRILRHLLLILVALAVVSAVRIVGALLSTALLVTPAATGCLLARTVPGILLAACTVGVLSGFVGLCLSWHLDLPPGASIVLVCAGCFVIAWIINSLKRNRVSTRDKKPLRKHR